MRSDLFSGHLGEILFFVEFAIKATVNRFVILFMPETFHGFTEDHSKIDRPGPCPTGSLPVTGYQGVVFHPDKSPHVFIIIIVDLSELIELRVTGLTKCGTVVGENMFGVEVKFDSGRIYTVHYTYILSPKKNSQLMFDFMY